MMPSASTRSLSMISPSKSKISASSPELRTSTARESGQWLAEPQSRNDRQRSARDEEERVTGIEPA